MNPYFKKYGIPGLWLAGVLILLWSGTGDDGYLIHVLGKPLPHPYPIDGVLTFILIATIETLILYGIIRPKTYVRSWARGVSALVAFAGLTIFFALGLMHAPPYVVWHVIWLCCIVLVLFTLLVWSGIAAYRDRAHSRQRNVDAAK